MTPHPQTAAEKELQEDLQSHLGTAAMRDEEEALMHERVDHRHDELPPQFAETGVVAPGFLIESEGVQRRVMAGIGKVPKLATTGMRRLLANTLQGASFVARRLHVREGHAAEPEETDSDEIRAVLTASPQIKRPSAKARETTTTKRS